MAYKHKGVVLEAFPADLQILEEAEVVYETLPGWAEDISGVRPAFLAAPQRRSVALPSGTLRLPVLAAWRRGDASQF